MKKKLIGTLGVLVVGAVAVSAAVAYYGGSGVGTASAKAGTAPRVVSVTGETFEDLYPGDTQPVDITISLTGNGNARIGAVALDTTQGDQGISGLPVGCLRSWFTFVPPAANQFPAGANVMQGTPLVVSGGLTFEESGTLQDACSDAEIDLHLLATPA